MKQTEIGKIPRNWEVKELEYLCDVIDPHPSHRAPKVFDRGIPFAGIGDISIDGSINIEKARQIDPSEYLEHNVRYVINEKSIGYGRVGTVGKVVKLRPQKFKYCLSPTLAVLNPKNKIPFGFLFSILRSRTFFNRVLQNSSGSTRPSIGIKILRKIKVPFPPLLEQKTIASILSALDDKIELNLQMNKTLEAMAMALYKHWFVDFGPFQDGEFVESELGEIPKGWEVKPLSAVTSKITDGAHHSPKSVKRGMPMASVKDMRAWNFNINTCRKISDEDYEKLINQGCKPMKNDVVIAKDGSYLKHAFVVEKDLDIVLLSSIAILKPNGLLDAQLLNLYLKLNSVKSRMKSIVSGAAIQRIVLKEFRKFLTIIPPIEIQNKALEEIDILIKKCWNNNSENQSLTKLRDTLLPKLISGEVRVKEAAEIISESM